MKKIFINDDNLDRVDKNWGGLTFPGGHVELDEDKEEALIREIKEETGIGIKDVSGPFMEIVTYAKRYFGSDKNVCNRIFYYRVLSDDTPNLEETNYDELESQSEFGLFYVHIDDLKHFLHNCLENGTIDVSIGREMLLALEEYNYLFGGVL